jgi:hypothetical protein
VCVCVCVCVSASPTQSVIPSPCSPACASCGVFPVPSVGCGGAARPMHDEVRHFRWPLGQEVVTPLEACKLTIVHAMHWPVLHVLPWKYQTKRPAACSKRFSQLHGAIGGMSHICLEPLPEKCHIFAHAVSFYEAVAPSVGQI